MKPSARVSFVAFSLMAAALLTICSVTSAHSGRTDGSGGHWNRSTGEYHYHHGYSAHQHYDIDGDGKKDCPYIFSKDNSTKTTNSAFPSFLEIAIPWAGVAIITFFILKKNRSPHYKKPIEKEDKKTK